jgi:cytochrome P450
MSNSSSLYWPNEDSYGHYGELPSRAPIQLCSEQGFWAVSRYRDVISVLRRPDLFSSSVMSAFDRCLLGADPPAHTRFRRIVSGIFSSNRLAALEGRVRAIVRRLLEPMKKSGQMELIAGLASPLPILVMIELLGADQDRAEDLKRWSGAVVAQATRRLTPTDKRLTAVGLRELNTYLEQLIERCQGQPERGVLNDLLVRPKEERLTSKEALSFARLLLVAGSESTTCLIGNAVLALLRHAPEMGKVQTNPRWISSFVEEVLRYAPPVQFVYRIALRDAEFGRVRVPAGARVAALLGFANRDPEHFPEPDRFLASRALQGHLGFGIGPHFCLGAQVASLETRVVLEELLSLPGTLRATQPLNSVEFTESIQIRGPKHLNLVFT